ncbi:hypothetical protein [Nocardioides sp.]|uniref:hypothetical protein n=1 Tax=Nocardioides sp. TaxID=35761 RepID=UPI0035B3A0C2
MKPVSGAMLLVAAVLTSPALAGAVMGAVPVDVALGRYLVVAGVCWVLLTVASEWLWSEPKTPATAEAPVASSDGAPDAS